MVETPFRKFPEFLQCNLAEMSIFFRIMPISLEGLMLYFQRKVVIIVGCIRKWAAVQEVSKRLQN